MVPIGESTTVHAHLGYVVWWHIAGLRVSLDNLRERLRSAGFPLLPGRGDSASRLVGQAVECIPGAVGVRREGGVIFTPPGAQSDLARLRGALAGLPADGAPAGLSFVGVANTAENRVVLGDDVTAGLIQDLAALGRDLDYLRARGRTTRANSLGDRQARLRVLVERAALHKPLLTEVQQETVAETVVALERRLSERE